MGSKLTTVSFVEKAKIIHKNKYDYSLVDYVKSSTKIIITCPIHGPFQQRPNDHLTGYGCPSCAIERQKLKKRLLQENVIQRFKQKHGNKYDYSQVIYEHIMKKVIILCPEHGSFLQVPNNHLQGKGCYKCGRLISGNKKRTKLETFIEKASIVHNNKYDYSLVKYTTSTKKVPIICKKHGEFQSTPSNHLQGYGCPTCGHRISKSEIEWLDYHNIPDTPTNRQVILWVKNSRYTVDGYLPETKTIYEFNGDYWHGNPKYYLPNDINVRTHKTFRQLHTETLLKRQNFINAGYNVIHTWESDWLVQNKQPWYIKDVTSV